MQYLYSDGDLYHFMDTETYDQIALNSDQIGDTLKFVKENEMVKVCSHKGKRILYRASAVRRAADYGYRAWLQGRHRYRRHQACYC